MLLALVALPHKNPQRNIILIVELGVLVNTKISQAFALGVSPRLLAFIRLVAIYWPWPALVIAVPTILLLSIPLMETLASLDFREGSRAADVFCLATMKCFYFLSSRRVRLQ
jgi:hypothetical protein